MEGYLLVPPERSALLGKTAWKMRYVTVGTVEDRFDGGLPRPDLPRICSSTKLRNARKDLKAASALASTTDLSSAHTDTLWLTVFKQKGDIEPISHNPMSKIKSCEIQSIQLRKSDPSISTLIISFEVDTIAEKIRKRRSSRAGILQAPTSPYPNSLLFRTIPEQRYNIYDWQATIQPRIQPNTPDFAEESSSPFTVFKNPFERSGGRPHISKPILRPENTHRHTYTREFGDRPGTASLASPSTSLRSQRSDVSSQSSFLARAAGYPRHLLIPSQSTELPSPASTLGYEEQFITGMTNAQGRSSALPSHTRACSVSTTPTPPLARETILDRAFNLNYIPGSDRLPSADSGTMSSIARFEALMLEHDRRKAAADSSRPSTKERDEWSLAEEGASETESSYPPSRATNQGSVRDNFFDDAMQDEDEDQKALDDIPLKAQRALEYIMSGRCGTAAPSLPPRPKSSRSRSHNQYSAPFPPSPPVPIPTLPPRRQRPMSFSHGHSRTTSQDTQVSAQPTSLSSNQTLKRQSTASTKNNSLSEFAKRISSTSSLLLVQTNTRNSDASSVASTYREGEKEGGEGEWKGLGTSRLSGAGQMAGRPGMGVRRSTVAAETMRYTMGGFEGGYAQVAGAGERERGMPGGTPVGRGRWEDAKILQWRGSGLFVGGEGGFV